MINGMKDYMKEFHDKIYLGGKMSLFIGQSDSKIKKCELISHENPKYHVQVSKLDFDSIHTHSGSKINLYLLFC